MDDLQYVKDMLARANMRYAVAVSNEGSTLTVQGPRSRPPHRYLPIDMTFDADGRLTKMETPE